MDVRGFLRWQFEGTFRSLSFYGFALGTLGAILTILDVSHASWIFILGAILLFIDAVRAWFRFSYSLYNMERQQIERELRRKE